MSSNIASTLTRRHRLPYDPTQLQRYSITTLSIRRCKTDKTYKYDRGTERGQRNEF